MLRKPNLCESLPVAIKYWLMMTPPMDGESLSGNTPGSSQAHIHITTQILHRPIQTNIFTAFQHTSHHWHLVLENQLTNAPHCSSAFSASQCVIYTLPLDCVILSEGANLREMGTDDGTRRHMAPVSACADMWDWGAPPPHWTIGWREIYDR